MSAVGDWLGANARRERVWRRTDDPAVFFLALHRWWACRRRFMFAIRGRRASGTVGGGK